MSAQPIPPPHAVTSTSHNHNERKPLQSYPQVSRLDDQAVIHLHWEIHCIPRWCMTKNNCGEVSEDKITFKK